MIKKALMIMLFLMCVSTNPLAMAACYCGGVLDDVTYVECTKTRLLNNASAANDYADCMAALEDKEWYILQCMFGGTEAECIEYYEAAVLDCNITYNTSIGSITSTWNTCTSDACI